VPVVAYLIARRLTGPREARWAALFAAALPALLVFSPTPDQLFAFLSLVALWLVIIGIQRRQPLWLGLGGLALSIMTMLSIGNAAWAGVVFLFAVVAMRRAEYTLRQIIAGGIVLTTGVASLWLIYWVGWAVAPREVILTGLEQHRQLVTIHRSYGQWLLYNPIDFVLFAGVAVFAGLVGQSLAAVRDAAERRSVSSLMALVLLLTLIALNLSGATRGEVGRLWLLFMPAAAIVAGGYWLRVSGRGSDMLLLLASQLVLALAIGLAWRPIQAVILPVTQPDFSTVSAASLTPVNVAFQSPGDNPLTLAGVAIVERDGEPAIAVDLFWSAGRPTVWPYTVFVHVLAENGELVAQQDGWPVAGQWPTTCWAGGELIADARQIPLPADLPAGRYAIVAGLYDTATGARLTTEDGQDSVLLGEIARP
jgi:4-amino-4-deoxy-L-arabinose transferase-like glycosyltransferase